MKIIESKTNSITGQQVECFENNGYWRHVESENICGKFDLIIAPPFGIDFKQYRVEKIILVNFHTNEIYQS